VSFPWRDWQFWVATAVALFAAWWVLRNLFGVFFEGSKAKRKRRARRATLTIEGKAPESRGDGR